MSDPLRNTDQPSDLLPNHTPSTTLSSKIPLPPSARDTSSTSYETTISISPSHQLRSMEQQINANTAALSRIEQSVMRIEQILITNNRPLDPMPESVSIPYCHLGLPPELRNKPSIARSSVSENRLIYVPQPEHLPTALSTLQQSMNSLIARVDGVHSSTYKNTKYIHNLTSQVNKSLLSKPSNDLPLPSSSASSENIDPPSTRSRKRGRRS